MLPVRKICDSDSKFERRSAEYQKCLIAREYKPSKVKKQFSDGKNTSREKARKLKTKSNFPTSCNLITQYNTMLPNIKTIFEKYLPVLHSNQEMLLLQDITINVTYKSNKKLKGLISPSLFLKAIKGNSCLIENCSRRSGICKHFVAVTTRFIGRATKHNCKTRSTLISNNKNVIYLLTCKCCSKQYIGFVTGFKEVVRTRKKDIYTKRLRVE